MPSACLGWPNETPNSFPGGYHASSCRKSGTAISILRILSAKGARLLLCAQGNKGHHRSAKVLGLRTSTSIRRARSSDGRFVWISLHEPDQPLLRTVQQRFGLHDLAIEDALRARQRPKLEIYGNSLFIVLRTTSLHPNSHLALRIAAASHAVAGRARRTSLRRMWG